MQFDELFWPLCRTCFMAPLQPFTRFLVLRLDSCVLPLLIFPFLSHLLPSGAHFRQICFSPPSLTPETLHVLEYLGENLQKSIMYTLCSKLLLDEMDSVFLRISCRTERLTTSVSLIGESSLECKASSHSCLDGSLRYSTGFGGSAGCCILVLPVGSHPASAYLSCCAGLVD